MMFSHHNPYIACKSADTAVSLILGPDMHRDLRGFYLFIVKMLHSTIGKKIRSNTISADYSINDEIEKMICMIF